MNVHNPEKKGLFLGSSSFEAFHLTLRVIVYDNLTKLSRKTTVYVYILRAFPSLTPYSLSQLQN